MLHRGCTERGPVNLREQAVSVNRKGVSAQAIYCKLADFGRISRSVIPVPPACASVVGSGHKMVVGWQNSPRWLCQPHCFPAAFSEALRSVSPPEASRPHALPSTPAQSAQRAPPPALPGLGKAAARAPAGAPLAGRGGSPKDGRSSQWQGAGSVTSPAPAPIGCLRRRRLRRCSAPGCGSVPVPARG